MLPSHMADNMSNETKIAGGKSGIKPALARNDEKGGDQMETKKLVEKQYCRGYKGEGEGYRCVIAYLHVTNDSLLRPLLSRIAPRETSRCFQRFCRSALPSSSMHRKLPIPSPP